MNLLRPVILLLNKVAFKIMENLKMSKKKIINVAYALYVGILKKLSIANRIQPKFDSFYLQTSLFPHSFFSQINCVQI